MSARSRTQEGDVHHCRRRSVGLVRVLQRVHRDHVTSSTHGSRAPLTIRFVNVLVLFGVETLASAVRRLTLCHVKDVTEVAPVTIPRGRVMVPTVPFTRLGRPPERWTSSRTCDVAFVPISTMISRHGNWLSVLIHACNRVLSRGSHVGRDCDHPGAVGLIEYSGSSPSWSLYRMRQGRDRFRSAVLGINRGCPFYGGVAVVVLIRSSDRRQYPLRPIPRNSGVLPSARSSFSSATNGIRVARGSSSCRRHRPCSPGRPAPPPAVRRLSGHQSKGGKKGGQRP